MEKLNKIQKELKAPKNQRNNFGNYNYRSCEDIMEAIKPLLWKATLTVSDEVVLVWDRIYVKATATIKEWENSESTTAFAREPQEQKGMNEAQITWSASSYARKYALNWLFAIDDTKDADATNTHGKEENKNNSSIYVMTQKDVELWNGKIYGRSVYINEEKKTISDEQIAKLKAHAKYVELPAK